ncbi:methyltransferase [Streptomyces sp. NBC_01240]|uniref:methyltransferase n=1 Tax=Streptomyces sp. NBC_01240 TaxID=2903793 RepID=UPI002E0E808D|nr:methyltransferase [Streptomyces sp. NBC_01240]
MRIAPDVLSALTDRAETAGNRLVLAGPRMDARLYQKVDEILEAVGGRWTRSAGAHLFPMDAAEALAPVLASGEVVTLREKLTQAQYFPTPPPVVERLIELADLKPGMTVLEPSAGSGAIATAAAARGVTVDCVERDPGYAAVLKDAGVARQVQVADFLTVPAAPQYDRVVMNPPFTRGTDMAHVEHALRFLNLDGLLVAVMSWAATYHSAKTAPFRALVEARGGKVEAVAHRAFAESGTDVDTVIVAIPARRAAGAAPTVWPVRDLPAQDEPQLGTPAEIVAEIQANLREALAAFDEVAAALASPPAAKAQPAEVAELPAPRDEPTLFDLLDEAS